MVRVFIAEGGRFSAKPLKLCSGQRVPSSITDDGGLDQGKSPCTLRDPLAIAHAADDVAELKPYLPLAITLWLLAALAGSVGWLRCGRPRSAKQPRNLNRQCALIEIPPGLSPERWLYS